MCEFFIPSASYGVMYASRRSLFYWMAAFCVGTAGDGFCAVSVSAAKLKRPFRASQMSTPEDVLLWMEGEREVLDSLLFRWVIEIYFMCLSRWS